MQDKAKHRNPRKPGSRYQKVFDSRKRRVRGLWQRNEKFYCNLTVSDDLGRKSSQWVELRGANFTEVLADYHRVLTESTDDRLRAIGLKPKLRDYIDESYLKTLAASGKRASSIAKETAYLHRWSKKIGQLRLNKIRPFHLSRFLTDLAADDYSGRSVNLYLIAIRSVLKAALRDGFVKPPLPFEGLQWQRVDQKARELFTPDEVNKFCEAALAASKNGRQFVDYLRFLQYSGARRSEALRVRWQDVDFERGHVTIGAEGDSKNREPRVVDFNPSLEAHLKEMRTRRQPDSQWLFPSPQRGDNDTATKTFMESLRLTRLSAGHVCQDCQRIVVGTSAVARCPHCGSRRVQPQAHLLSAKLRRLGFHDFRHHFISYAVMSGLDYMTIARWAGHKDGGVLIGKIYGHLADSHRKAQAARLNFGPVVLPLAQAANA